jgi:hypothetical protein
VLYLLEVGFGDFLASRRRWNFRLFRRGRSLGDKTKAKEYFQKLTALAAKTDTVRPDLAAARQFLATN